VSTSGERQCTDNAGESTALGVSTAVCLAHRVRWAGLDARLGTVRWLGTAGWLGTARPLGSTVRTVLTVTGRL